MKLISQESDYWDYQIKAWGNDTRQGIPTWIRTPEQMETTDSNLFHNFNMEHIQKINSPLLLSKWSKKFRAYIDHTVANDIYRMKFVFSIVIIGDRSFPVIIIKQYKNEGRLEPVHDYKHCVQLSDIYDTVTPYVNIHSKKISEILGVCDEYLTNGSIEIKSPFVTAGVIFNKRDDPLSTSYRESLDYNILLKRTGIQRVIDSSNAYQLIDMYVNYHFNQENDMIVMPDDIKRKSHGFTKCSFKSSNR